MRYFGDWIIVKTLPTMGDLLFDNPLLMDTHQNDLKQD